MFKNLKISWVTTRKISHQRGTVSMATALPRSDLAEIWTFIYPMRLQRLTSSSKVALSQAISTAFRIEARPEIVLLIVVKATKTTKARIWKTTIKHMVISSTQVPQTSYSLTRTVSKLCSSRAPSKDVRTSSKEKDF